METNKVNEECCILALRFIAGLKKPKTRLLPLNYIETNQVNEECGILALRFIAGLKKPKTRLLPF